MLAGCSVGGWLPQILEGVSPAECFAYEETRDARCLYAVQRKKSESLFLPDKDEYDYAD